MNKEFLGGILGTALSATGTATQTNEVLQTISLIITILGGIITLIVIPLLTWYKNAKKDGKITSDEIQEGVKIVQDGLENLKDKNKEDKEEDK